VTDPPRSFADALRSHPLFFEPAPPSARLQATRIEERVDALGTLAKEVERLDALVVPELVDENHEGRPRYRSGDVRGFAHRLQERTGRDVVVNKVVAYLDAASELPRWAEETVRQGLHHAVLVGGASRYIPYPGPSVVEANRICRPIFHRAGGTVGNIAIPQRTGEPHRMLAKTRAGAQFFTTQILFDAEQVIQMVREYDLLCRQAAIPPATLVLSFAPLADEEDIEFVRWLGADVPESAEQAILSGNDTEGLRRSESQALSVWASVRQGVGKAGLEVPLGVNVEQVSARHLEPAGHLLREFASRFAELPAPRGAQESSAHSRTAGPALSPGAVR
jgi:5,10-methylenetetrahydrofolate reductase